jgi:apolipoprotein N-acyltransferase
MITRVLKKAVTVFWLLPGFLLWASFPPMAEKTDCLFALAPLLWLGRNADSKTNFRKWYANGFFFWVATLSWMPAIVKNGGPWPLVVLGWGALAAYCALYFGAFGWFDAKIWAWVKDAGTAWRKPPRFPYMRRMLAILILEPLLWCGLELVRSRFLGGFSWNHLGVPLVVGGFGSPAAIGGVYLLSAVVILVNGTVAGIAERMIEPYRRAKGFHVVDAPKWARSLETILPIAIVFGLYQLAPVVNQRQTYGGTEELRVAAVQRNFPCVFNPRQVEDPIDVYSNLLANVSYVKPDIVVLPESALCEFGAVDSPRSRAFLSWISEMTGAREVIAGGGRYAEGREYNSAVLFQRTDSGVRLSCYDKVHLVPFGEFIPGDKWFTSLQKLAPVGSCTPGVLKLLGNYGVAICYEDTDSAQMRTLAKKGAKALVFITNDSWFSFSDETVQHAWQSVARAIETGLPVVRVGNSGVTGIVNPDGSAWWLADSSARPLADSRGTMCESVETGNCGVTPYVSVGDIPLAVLFVLLILAAILVKYKDNHEKRRYLSM